MQRETGTFGNAEQAVRLLVCVHAAVVSGFSSRRTVSLGAEQLLLQLMRGRGGRSFVALLANALVLQCCRPLHTMALHHIGAAITDVACQADLDLTVRYVLTDASCHNSCLPPGQAAGPHAEASRRPTCAASQLDTAAFA